MQISKLIPFKKLPVMHSFRMPESASRFIKCDEKWFVKNYNVYDLSTQRFYHFDDNASISDLGTVWADKADLSEAMKQKMTDQIEKEKSKAIRSIPESISAINRVADELKALRELLTPLVESMTRDNAKDAEIPFMNFDDSGDEDLPFGKDMACCMLNEKLDDFIKDIPDDKLPKKIKQNLINARFVHVGDFKYVKLKELKKVSGIGRASLRRILALLEHNYGILVDNSEPNITFSVGDKVACKRDLLDDANTASILTVTKIDDCTGPDFVLTAYGCENADGSFNGFYPPSELKHMF